IKCPNCSLVTTVTDGRKLPKNFAILSMAEQAIKSRIDPKVICKSCEIKVSSTSIRMCLKEDCNMYNQLICVNCVVDGGHGVHVVKYDVKMEKVRKELGEEIGLILSKVEDKKNNVLKLSERLTEITKTLKMNLYNANIPIQVIDQIASLSSEQDANELREIVIDLAKTITDECDALADVFKTTLETATSLDLFEEKEGAGPTEDPASQFREMIDNLQQNEQELKATIKDQNDQIQSLQEGIDKLCDALSESSERDKEALLRNKKLTKEMQETEKRNTELEEMLRESKIGALESAKRMLKFHEFEKLLKPFVCIQLGNGALLYFDNVKPFELFTNVNETRKNADLKLLEGEYDCTFKGTIGNCAYFRSVRGKIIKFFRASVDSGRMNFELINEMKTSEISLFDDQSLYFIELSREWSVYHYHENYTEKEGEKFEIPVINHLSKYERHYHRGVIYLFRENSKAVVERLNEKVVRVEGPLLMPDVTYVYTSHHTDSIYILNAELNVILILNTTKLSVSQLSYEPPTGSNNHSIVGIHDGILSMAFDGVWGRHLFTTRMDPIYSVVKF
ncbi:hypothetical protein PENTCL1PPCAC_5188, partial [Pristionchus entomophagus]